jgi:hypothetical protein
MWTVVVTRVHIRLDVFLHAIYMLTACFRFEVPFPFTLLLYFSYTCSMYVHGLYRSVVSCRLLPRGRGRYIDSPSPDKIIDSLDA